MSALKPFLTNIANAIREKKQTTAPIPAQSFANEILSIEGGSAVTDTPLTITSNGTTESPEDIRYTPITVAVPKPTLNAPLISVNVSNGTLSVHDSTNGNFTTDYLLYINGEQVGAFTSKTVNVMEYKTIDGSETIQVKSTNSEFFNDSEFSNSLVWSEIADGTPGLSYSGNTCWGKGTATETTIYVGSIVNGTTITGVGGFSYRENYIIYLPDTITNIESRAFGSSVDIKVIFGVNTSYIGMEAFWISSGLLDFRKATKIPTLAHDNAIASFNGKIVVPDNLYDEWIIATNWTVRANNIIRATDYEAQQGGEIV